MSRIGDLDGDNSDDLLLGVYNFDLGASNRGFASVLRGSDLLATTPGTVLSTAELSPRFMGEASNEAVGFNGLSTLGDLDADGYDEVFFGIWANDDSCEDCGKAVVIYGRPSP